METFSSRMMDAAKQVLYIEKQGRLPKMHRCPVGRNRSLAKRIAAGLFIAGLGLNFTAGMASAENWSGDKYGNANYDSSGTLIETGDITNGYIEIKSGVNICTPWSDSADSPSYKKGNTFYDVYGAYTSNGSVTCNWSSGYNTTIAGTAYQNVYGGYSTGSVSNYGVDITGSVASGATHDEAWTSGYVEKTYSHPAVYGGKSTGTSGTISQNKASVESGATVNGSVYGGYSSEYLATYDNYVYIYGTVTDANLDVSGSWDANTSGVYNQTTTISADAISTIAGGYAAGKGNVNSNHVILYSGANVTSNIYGSYSAGYSDYVGGWNTVEINGGATVNKSSITEIGTIAKIYSGFDTTTLEPTGLTSTTSGSSNTYYNYQGIYGSYAVTGNVYSNTVTIGDDTTTTATVNIPVYGGYTKSGYTYDSSAATPVGNTVVVKANGVVNSNVYGGYANPDDSTGTSGASYNTVTVAGKVTGEVKGGVGYYGDASNNSITISDGAVLTGYYVQAGYGTNSVSNNSITVGTIGGTGATVGSELTGGYVNTYTTSGTRSANNNTITINSGTLTRNIRGVYVSEAADTVTGNKVIVNGGTIEASSDRYKNATGNTTVEALQESTGGGSIYGAYNGGSSTNMDNNSVEINGGSVTAAYGSYASGGSATASNTITNSSVKVTNGSVTLAFGARNRSKAVASNNSVTVSGGTVKYAFGVYGDPATQSYNPKGDLANNTATISGGTVNYVAGAYLDDGEPAYNSSYTENEETTKTAVKDNKVTISGGTVGTVYGSYNGYKYAEDITGSSVTVSGGEVENIYGAYSASGATTHKTSKAPAIAGDADNNSVTISGGKVTGTVYAAYSANNTTNTLSDNTVTISYDSSSNTATKADLTSASLYGTNSTGSLASGNKLVIDGWTGSVNSVNNFNTIDFKSIALDNTNSTVIATTAASDLSNTAITVEAVTGDLGKTYLFKSDNLTTTGATLTVTGAGIIKTDTTTGLHIASLQGTVGEHEIYVEKVDSGLTGTYIDSTGTSTASTALAADGTFTVDTTNASAYSKISGIYSAGTSDATGSMLVLSTSGTESYANNIYGGYSEQGNASSNTVTINDLKSTGNVYGGYAATSGKVANNNTIIIGGVAGTDLSTTSIYGSNVTGSTGNVLELKTYTGNIKSINNINTINIDSVSLSDAGAVIALDGTSTSDLSGVTVNVKAITGGDVMQAGTTKHIITGISKTSGARLNVTGIEGSVFASSYVDKIELSGISAKVTNNSLDIVNGKIALTGKFTAKDGTQSTLSSGSINTSADPVGDHYDQIFGAYSMGNYDATGGAVNVDSDYTGTIYGGYALSGKATGNTVNMNGGNVTGIIIGGSSNSNSTDAVSNNTLNVTASSSATNIESFAKINIIEDASGAVKLSLTDTDDTTNISGATVNVDLSKYIGTISKGDSLTVLSSAKAITDSEATTYTVNGKAKESILATSNNYVMSSDVVAQKNSSGNAVEVTATNVVMAGSYTDASGNTTVSQSGGLTLDGTVQADTYAGNYALSGSAGSATAGVTTTIDSGNTNTVYDTVYGGYAENGDVTNNTVTVNSGTITNLYAGYSKSNGTISNNTVNVNGGTITNLYAGNTDATVKDNNINIKGGTVSNVYLINGNNKIDLSGSTATIGNIDYGAVDKDTKTEVTIENGATIAADATIDLSTSDSTVNVNAGNIAGTVKAKNIDVTAGSTISGELDATNATLSGSTSQPTTVSGTVTASDSLIIKDGVEATAASKLSGKDVAMNGGTVAGTVTSSDTLTINNGVDAAATSKLSGKTVAMNGGTVAGTIEATDATISGGNMSGALNATNSLTINGGELSGSQAVTAKTMVVSGGTVSNTNVTVSEGLTVSGTGNVSGSVNAASAQIIGGVVSTTGKIKTTGDTAVSGGDISGTIEAANVEFSGGTLSESGIILTTGKTSVSKGEVLGTVTADSAAVSGGNISGTINASSTDVTGGTISGTINSNTINIKDTDSAITSAAKLNGKTITADNATLAGTVTVSGTDESSGVVILQNNSTGTATIQMAEDVDTSSAAATSLTIDNSSFSGKVNVGTITVENNANVAGAELSAHTINLKSLSTGLANKISKLYLTGSTLNVAQSDVYAGSIGVTEGKTATYNFFISNTAEAGSTMLTVTDSAADLSNAIVNAAVVRDNSATAATSLKDGDTITLLSDVYGIDTTGVSYNKTASTMVDGTGYSIVMNTDITEVKTGDLVTSLKATVKEEASEQSKSYVETQSAVTGMLASSLDMLAEEGFANASDAVENVTLPARSEMTPFFAIGGSNLRYNTGSHIDTKGINMALGFAKTVENKYGSLLFGPVITYSRGSYDSYVSGLHASGDTSAWGIGMVAKESYKNGTYLEGSIQFGRTKSDYKGDGDAGSYDNDAAYYAAHVGVGKLQPVSDHSSIDYYGKFFLTHQNGSRTTLQNVANPVDYSFNAVNSKRLRLGGRYNMNVSKLSTLYAGLAWQYEFGGDANATIYSSSGTFGAPSPSLKGGSGMYEFGWQYKPADQDLSIDLGITGYSGRQKGVTFGVKFNFSF